MKLSKKETKAFKAIVDNALEGMGGKEPRELLDDNYSWFERKDVSDRAGFNKNEAAGLISALDKKDLIMAEDDKGRDDDMWFMTEKGINLAQDLFV